MIRQLEPGAWDEFHRLCHTDPFVGARVKTVHTVYGNDWTRCNFWLAETEGENQAVLAKTGGLLLLIAEKTSDFAELSAFIRTMDRPCRVESALETLEQLDLPGSLSSSTRMRYAGEEPQQEMYPVNPSPAIQDVVSVLKQAQPGFVDTGGWYTHVSHVIRHGLGFAAVIVDKGTPVATGGVYSMTSHCGVISDIATLPRYRNRGYGGAVTLHLARRLIRAGRLPLLQCRADHLTPFYQRLGFTVCGKWGGIAL